MSKAHYIVRINKVIDYIDAHLDEKLQLDDLARVAMFSKYHFHRVFKSITGENLNEFIKRVRMIKAYRLLQVDYSLDIVDLAEKIGYGSLANFSRDFKAFYSISPTQARKRSATLQQPSKQPMAKQLEVTFEGISLLPERYVLFKKTTNGYDTEFIPKLSNELYQLALQNDFPIEQFIGIGYDDPDYTPAERCRYDICIAVKKSQVPRHLACNGKIINGGRFAIFRFSGHKAYIAAAWDYLFKEWLVKSNFLPDDRPHLELYRESERYREGYFCVDLCLPVKPIEQ